MKTNAAAVQQGATMTLVVLFLVGCVGGDMRETISQGGSGSGLSAEQRSHLREAAKSGEPELLTLAARLSWDYPEQKEAIAAYVLELRPQ
jgi:hypothetical protein